MDRFPEDVITQRRAAKKLTDHGSYEWNLFSQLCDRELEIEINALTLMSSLQPDVP